MVGNFMCSFPTFFDCTNVICIEAKVLHFFALISKHDILQIYLNYTEHINLMFIIKLHDCFHMAPKVVILHAFFLHRAYNYLHINPQNAKQLFSPHLL